MKRARTISPSNVVVPYGDFIERRDRRRRVLAELKRQGARRIADAKAAARRISRDQKCRYTRPRPVTQQTPDHVADNNRCEWTGVWDAHPGRHDTYLRDPGYVHTPFPTRPIDVVALTVQEFMSDLDMDHAPSLDVICRRFVADANLALVWWIRFRALKAWCTRADMIDWLHTAEAPTSRDLCEVAASLELNDRWEFEAERFCSAVDVMVSERSRCQ
jgi:hypothetical protein